MYTFINSSVTVIIPTYNRCVDLEKTLECLARQDFKDFRVLVIDNGSSDNTPQILEKFAKKYPNFSSVYEPKKNIAFLLNLGIKSCSSETLVFINDDVYMPDSWLKLLLGTFNQYRNVSLVGGPTIATRKQEIARLYELRSRNILMRAICWLYNSVVMDGKLMEVGVHLPWGAYSIGGSEYKTRELKDNFFVDILSITNIAIKRDVFEKIGYFDENFLFAHYDGDFFIRVRKVGYKQLFNPSAWLLHKVNPTGATRRAFFIGRDIGYYLVKSVRPKSLNALIRYFLYAVFINLFWVYKTTETKKINQLLGICGFFRGITDFLRKTFV